MSHLAFTPSHRASSHFGRHSFPVPQRVGGWVGPTVPEKRFILVFNYAYTSHFTFTFTYVLCKSFYFTFTFRFIQIDGSLNEKLETENSDTSCYNAGRMASYTTPLNWHPWRMLLFQIWPSSVNTVANGGKNRQKPRFFVSNFKLREVPVPIPSPIYKNRTANFTSTMSSIAAMVSTVRDDRGRRLTSVRLIELIVYNFRRKSSNACLFTFC